LNAALIELERAARALVVLVAARREASQSLMALMSKRRIHRLMIKPAASGITRLLLESAVGRYLQLREQAPVVMVEDVRPKRRQEKPRSSLRLWLVATLLVVSIIGGAVAMEQLGLRRPESF